MSTLRDIAQVIEAVAPRDLQESYDNAGLQCGNPQQEVSTVLTCLDVTEATIAEACRRGCQLVVSHHPLLFHGVKCVSPEAGYVSRTLLLAIQHGIGIYAAHTNLDKARGGLNDDVAARLSLTDVTPMSDCGVWGRLPHPMTARQLTTHIGDVLHTRLRYNADARQLRDGCVLSTLALCTGAGSDFISEAEALGADAYLTGELRYHEWFGHPDMLLLEGGHFETEQFAPQVLAHIISAALPDVQCCIAESHQSPIALATV